ncbi:alpha-methylacyl-CoA racemase [Rhodotorula toruloides]|nr:alpha-methylacyl-CoA racemase [Rhodotorula toruloides]
MAFVLLLQTLDSLWMAAEGSRPLAGIRVLELAGLAPAPFAGLVLADYGADVVRVDRQGTSFNVDTLTRGKRSLAVSLKSPEGISLLRTLLGPPSNGKDWRADILIDPFRPGVLERLGLDPKDLLAKNPRLIIARLTGFRREGPYAKMAGHDINYLALSGVLPMLGRKGDKPYFPANLLADFAGGGMMAVLGILAALIERTKSGKGQIVEIDMVTGTRYSSIFPLTMARPSLGLPMWSEPRGKNILDGGAPWYDVYECKDAQYMSLGPIENHFYAKFLDIFIKNVPASIVPSPRPTASTQLDRSTWPSLVSFFTSGFRTKTRDEWSRIFLGTDACCVPVLNRHEVDLEGRGPDEPDRLLGEEEAEDGGGLPMPTPRLSRTPAKAGEAEEAFLEPGRDTVEILEAAGLGGKVDELVKAGAVGAGESRSKL